MFLLRSFLSYYQCFVINMSVGLLFDRYKRYSNLFVKSSVTASDLKHSITLATSVEKVVHP